MRCYVGRLGRLSIVCHKVRKGTVYCRGIGGLLIPHKDATKQKPPISNTELLCFQPNLGGGGNLPNHPKEATPLEYTPPPPGICYLDPSRCRHGDKERERHFFLLSSHQSVEGFALLTVYNFFPRHLNTSDVLVCASVC